MKTQTVTGNGENRSRHVNGNRINEGTQTKKKLELRDSNRNFRGKFH